MKKTPDLVKIGKNELAINKKNKEYIPFNQKIVGYKKVLDYLAYAIKNNKPTLIIGETGVGKTALIRYLAHQTNNGFRRLNLNGQTTIDEFVGKTLINKQGTYWQDGVLTDALRKGYWLLLDELNGALPEILFVLHSLLDDDGFIVLSEKDGEVVKPHPNFRLFATMNPSGKYAGTKELNKALLSRFPIILQLDFPNPKEETKILNLYVKKIDEKIIPTLIKMANDLRLSYKKDEIEYVCSTRDLINCVKIAQDKGITEALTLTIINRCQEEDVKAVKTIVSLYFGIKNQVNETKDFEEELNKTQKKIKQVKEIIGGNVNYISNLVIDLTTKKEPDDINYILKKIKDTIKETQDLNWDT